MLSKSFVFTNIFLTTIFIFISSLISLFYWTFFKKDKKLITGISFVLLLITFIISFTTMFFYGSLQMGYSTNILANILNTFIIMIAILSINFIYNFSDSRIKFGEFYFLFFMILAGSILLINTSDFLNIFLAIELISFSLYGIIAFEKKELNIESSIKYFMLGSFVSVFMIAGMALIYIKTNTLNLMELSNKHYYDVFLIIAVLFFMISLLFKISIVPFHSWSIDVYCGSPTYIVLLIVGFVKLSVIYTLVKIFFVFKNKLFIEIFYVLTLLTLILPNISALFTKNIKKILVYSSISHAGYMLLSLMGPDRWQIYYYAIVYSLNAFGAFAVLSIIEKNYENTEYKNLKGLYYSNPYISLSLAIFLFSLAGVPPFAGFFAKFYSFYNAVKGEYIYLVIIAAITSAISLYYYLKILIPIFFEKPDNEKKLIVSNNTLTIIYIIAIVILIFGISSNPIIELFKKIS